MSRWLLVILLPLCILACSDRDQVQSGTILPAEVELKAGDVVFRRGSGFTSQVVLMAEHGETYSHVGIVADSAGVPMIVHAVPGELEDDDEEDRVKMECPEVFFDKVKAREGAVYRHQDPIAARHAAQRAVNIYRRGTLFDHSYDDSDTTQMYCTELVKHAYTGTTRPLTRLVRHHLHLVGFEADCILPSDIQRCPELKLVTMF